MSVITLQRRPRVASLDSAEARARSVRRRVAAAWALLYFNTLTYVPGSILHIPDRIGKGLAQGALPLAILVLLTVNPKVRLRPNVFLCLVSLLVADTVITTMTAFHLGTIYRTFRLAEFVAALWLLTPWWGRHDMLLLRCHLRCLFWSLGSVLLGLLIAPGKARAYAGRLSGVIWPMEPTQVAQYAAVAAGLAVVLWLARLLSGRVALAGVTFAVAILLLTHTRTALTGPGGGHPGRWPEPVHHQCAGAEVLRGGCGRRVDRGRHSVSGVVTTWLARGENAQGLASLSGRTTLWAAVLNVPRTKFEEIFGFGLSNAGINGNPIDSNWLSSYMQEGLFGVAVCAVILVWLFVIAFFQPPGVRRAMALFLVTYCTIASFTEDAFTDASTYLLHLTVAASLLIAPLARKDAPRAP